MAPDAAVSSAPGGASTAGWPLGLAGSPSSEARPEAAEASGVASAGEAGKGAERRLGYGPRALGTAGGGGGGEAGRRNAALVTTVAPPYRSPPIRAVKLRAGARASQEYSPTHDIPSAAAGSQGHAGNTAGVRPVRQRASPSAEGGNRTVRFQEDAAPAPAPETAAPPPEAAPTPTQPARPTPAVPPSPMPGNALRCCTVHIDTAPLDAKYQIGENDSAAVAFRVLLEVYDRLNPASGDMFQPAPRSPHRDAEAIVAVGPCGVLLVEDGGNCTYLPRHFIKGFTLRESIEFPGCGDMLLVAASEDDSIRGNKTNGMPPLRLYSCLAPMVVARCIYVALTEYTEAEARAKEKEPGEPGTLKDRATDAPPPPLVTDAMQYSPTSFGRLVAQDRASPSGGPSAPSDPVLTFPPALHHLYRTSSRVVFSQASFVLHHLASPFVAVYDLMAGNLKDA